MSKTIANIGAAGIVFSLILGASNPFERMWIASLIVGIIAAAFWLTFAWAIISLRQ